VGAVSVIAEAGVNHNGSTELAFQLVDAAVEAGADVVKFQTFITQNLVTKSADLAPYQKKGEHSGSGSQYDLLKQLELDAETYHQLIDYCAQKGIGFLSTAFDHESLHLLTEELELKVLKVSSGEITNGPLLLEHARTGCDLILSTGMATLDEIREALSVIAFGLLRQVGEPPSSKAFHDAYLSGEGQSMLKQKVTLLHCTTEYPAPVDEINLSAIETLREAFGLPVGYSDHSQGVVVPIAAAAMGAAIIEKHFTLDKGLSGPDHQASLDPTELKAMVSQVRLVERAIGNGVKVPSPSELNNRSVVRKSLVAAKEIHHGERFTQENVTVKRPGNGRSPMDYWELMGTEAVVDYLIDDLIATE